MTQLPSGSPSGWNRPPGAIGWTIVWLVLAILGIAWFVANTNPSITFSELAHGVGVKDVDRYARLASLGLTLIAVTLLYKLLRSR